MNAIGIFLIAVSLIVVFLVIAAWFLTIGWNDCGLYEFFNASKLSFEQALGAVITVGVLGQTARLGPK